MIKWRPDNIPTKTKQKPKNPKQKPTQKPGARYREDLIFKTTKKLTAPADTFVKRLFHLPLKKNISYCFSSYLSLVSSEFSNFWHGKINCQDSWWFAISNLQITELWSRPWHHSLKQLLEVTGRPYRFCNYNFWDIFQCSKTH